MKISEITAPVLAKDSRIGAIKKKYDKVGLEFAPLLEVAVRSSKESGTQTLVGGIDIDYEDVVKKVAAFLLEQLKAFELNRVPKTFIGKIIKFISVGKWG